MEVSIKLAISMKKDFFIYYQRAVTIKPLMICGQIWFFQLSFIRWLRVAFTKLGFLSISIF